MLNEYLFNGLPVNETDGGYRVQPVADSFAWEEYETFAQRIKKNIDDGYPSILQINVNRIYGGNSCDNHNVVVCGYEQTFKTKNKTQADRCF